MYKLTLAGKEYARVDGDFKTIKTYHRFECPDITTLMQLVGNMAEASTEPMELTIAWE